MKHSVPFRIKVVDPPGGIVMKVQKGKAELLEPLASRSPLTFEFDVTVDLSGESPNFLGPFSQGPKDSRFIYVNSGSYAGQHGILWNRRAKLSLTSISQDSVEKVVASTLGRFETTIQGTGRDGGPVAASIKGLEWEVVPE